MALLKTQHGRMLRERPEIGPGEFKRQNNRAGATHFVDWQGVEGTLREGYRLYPPLPEGLPRAVYLSFVVSEVHPFTDGNGRISRVLMNSELTAAGLQRIIVTTADRDSYLSALRAMTHNGLAGTLESVLATFQRRTAEIDFSGLDIAKRELTERQAFTDPGECANRASRS